MLAEPATRTRHLLTIKCQKSPVCREPLDAEWLRIVKGIDRVESRTSNAFSARGRE
jgi:hypothetical protein